MANILLEKVDYHIEETPWGVWRRFLYPTGAYFAEFRSHRTLFGLPLLHFTRGICPETGKRVVARGVVAVGRLAVGILALGQAAAGLVAVGQLGLGLLFGLGQAATGVGAVGQLTLGLYLAVGQLAASNSVTIAQLGYGKFVLAQIGYGEYVWSTERADPEAVAFFQSLLQDYLKAWGN
jgi:hypothetical protein